MTTLRDLGLTPAIIPYLTILRDAIFYLGQAVIFISLLGLFGIALAGQARASGIGLAAARSIGLRFDLLPDVRSDGFIPRFGRQFFQNLIGPQQPNEGGGTDGWALTKNERRKPSSSDRVGIEERYAEEPKEGLIVDSGNLFWRECCVALATKPHAFSGTGAEIPNEIDRTIGLVIFAHRSGLWGGSVFLNDEGRISLDKVGDLFANIFRFDRIHRPSGVDVVGIICKFLGHCDEQNWSFNADKRFIKRVGLLSDFRVSVLHDAQLTIKNPRSNASEDSPYTSADGGEDGSQTFRRGFWVLGVLDFCAIVCGIAAYKLYQSRPELFWIPFTAFAVVAVVACLLLSHFSQALASCALVVRASPSPIPCRNLLASSGGDDDIGKIVTRHRLKLRLMAFAKRVSIVSNTPNVHSMGAGHDIYHVFVGNRLAEPAYMPSFWKGSELDSDLLSGVRVGGFPWSIIGEYAYIKLIPDVLRGRFSIILSMPVDTDNLFKDASDATWRESNVSPELGTRCVSLIPCQISKQEGSKSQRDCEKSRECLAVPIGKITSTYQRKSESSRIVDRAFDNLLAIAGVLLSGMLAVVLYAAVVGRR